MDIATLNAVIPAIAAISGIIIGGFIQRHITNINIRNNKALQKLEPYQKLNRCLIKILDHLNITDKYLVFSKQEIDVSVDGFLDQKRLPLLLSTWFNDEVPTDLYIQTRNLIDEISLISDKKTKKSLQELRLLLELHLGANAYVRGGIPLRWYNFAQALSGTAEQKEEIVRSLVLGKKVCNSKDKVLLDSYAVIYQRWKSVDTASKIVQDFLSSELSK